MRGLFPERVVGVAAGSRVEAPRLRSVVGTRRLRPCPGPTAARSLRSCVSLGLEPSLRLGVSSCLFRPVSSKMA